MASTISTHITNHLSDIMHSPGYRNYCKLLRNYLIRSKELSFKAAFSRKQDQPEFREIWTVEAQWSGELPIRKLDSKSKQQSKQTRNSHGMRKYIEECFSVYGQLRKNDYKKRQFACEIPEAHLNSLSSNPRRKVIIRFEFEGTERILEQQRQKLFKMIFKKETYKFPGVFDEKRKEYKHVIFKHIKLQHQRPDRTKIIRKQRPVANSSKLRPNQFIMINVDKRITRATIVKVFRQFTDLSTLARPEICLKSVNNIWLGETIVQLTQEEIQKIETQLHATVLPKLLRHIDLDTKQIRQDLKIQLKIDELEPIIDIDGVALDN